MIQTIKPKRKLKEGGMGSMSESGIVGKNVEGRVAGADMQIRVVANNEMWRRRA